MRLFAEPDRLTITMEGVEQIWALKRQLQIPHEDILNIDYQPAIPSMQDYAGYLRFPGTSIPWRFLAGTFTRHGEREFWYIKVRQPGVLVLLLKPGLSGYSKVRITCTPEIAQNIADWWQEGK